MKGHILLEGIVGSTAYGSATENSDVDKLGMFAAPTDDFLGLGNPTASIVKTNPDKTLHEARKWCRLALKCNPTAMELAWLPDDLYEIRTDLGEQLIEIRDAFLSRQAVRNAYLGYATQQLAKLKATTLKMDSHERPEAVRDRRHKHARHVVRLLSQGTGLHANKFLEVRLDKPELIWGMGEEVVADPRYGDSLLKAAEELFDEPGVLPEEPSVTDVEDWLFAVRRHYLT